MIFIVGGKGLTGSAFVRNFEKNHIEFKIIQKENKEEFFGKNCDKLIFANGNALKYKANDDPYFDFISSVKTVSEYVHKIKFKQFIHLSTIDVYHNKSNLKNNSENSFIDVSKLDNYGFHKLLAENYVKKYCSNYLIFRLGGLVGTGLKKNPAFDFINPHKKVMISSNSNLNFINTNFVAKSILKIIDLGIENDVFNLTSKNSIKISDIKKIIGQDSEYDKNSENNIQNYHINNKKIQKFIELNSSEQAIEEYFRSI
jgi:nucleoside-diphosphate-sugar epimerase